MVYDIYLKELYMHSKIVFPISRKEGEMQTSKLLPIHSSENATRSHIVTCLTKKHIRILIIFLHYFT